MKAIFQQIDILDNLNTALVLIKTDLSVSYLNSSAEALLDVSGARVLGEPIASLFSEADDVDNSIFNALNSHQTLTKREAKLHLASRQIVTVDCAVSPIYDNNQIIAMIIELQTLDLVLRVNREEALLASQENAHLLVRGMAHEIKNPLGGLRGAAQLLAKQLPDQSLLDYTNIIIEEADRLSNLVDRMLGSNSLLDIQTINIHEILERVKQLIIAETDGDIVINRDYDPSTPDLQGDKEQLIQAVLNIARNAMQAIQNSHTVKPSISFKTRVLRQFTIGTQRHRLICHIDIIDNGPGIPEALLKTLFLPMVSGRANGTGLGLSLSQTIINHHKGIIECKSQPGFTVFSLYLPLPIKPLPAITDSASESTL